MKNTRFQTKAILSSSTQPCKIWPKFKASLLVTLMGVVSIPGSFIYPWQANATSVVYSDTLDYMYPIQIIIRK